MKLLNLKESRLREINVCQGNVKVLNTDLFPISVEYFTLLHMGIHKLPASLEELKTYKSYLYQVINLENKLCQVANIVLDRFKFKSM